MKDCGECALCCKLIEVKGLAVAGEWCPNCELGRKDGCCTIHHVRPEQCRNWHCFWRAEEWPDHLRPDRCKVIFEALPGVLTILVSVDTHRPDAWKRKDIREVIEKLRKKGRPLVLKTKNDSEMFIPKGWNQQDVLRDIEQVMSWKERGNGSTNIYN